MPSRCGTATGGGRLSWLPGRFVLRGGGGGFPRTALGGRSRPPIRPGVRGTGPGLGIPALGGGERARRGTGDEIIGRSGTIVSGADAGGPRNPLREAVSGGVARESREELVSRVELGYAEAAGVVFEL